MLGKLLKYEMKASARTLLPLYIGMLVVALFCSVQIAVLMGDGELLSFDIIAKLFGPDSLIPFFLFLLFFGLCVAIMVLTAMIIVQRFNKNLIGDEGYLMFTLPVTHVQLLSSKLIAGLLWVLIGTVVMGISAVLIWTPGILMASNDINWADLWQELWNAFSIYNPFPTILNISVSGLVTVVFLILTVYLSIMIAQMERFNKHRVAISVVLFFLINWVFSLIDSSILYLLGLSMVTVIESIPEMNTLFNGYLAATSGLTLIECIICFAGVIWLMKKKLNL